MHTLACKVHIALVRLLWHLTSIDKFLKNTIYLFSSKYVNWEPCFCVRTDRETDRQTDRLKDILKLIFIYFFFKFSNTSKNETD